MTVTLTNSTSLNFTAPPTAGLTWCMLTIFHSAFQKNPIVLVYLCFFYLFLKQFKVTDKNASVALPVMRGEGGWGLLAQGSEHLSLRAACRKNWKKIRKTFLGGSRSIWVYQPNNFCSWKMLMLLSLPV